MEPNLIHFKWGSRVNKYSLKNDEKIKYSEVSFVRFPRETRKKNV